MSLEGRVALVTGASRGIGREIAVRLARAGARVAVNFKNSEDKALALVKELGGDGVAAAFRADVSVAAEVSDLVARAIAAFGRIDILVNNAGLASDQYLPLLSERQWDEVMAVNLKGAFLCTKACVRDMMRRRWGRVINISSDAAETGDVMRAHYCASKSGMVGLTRACALELSSSGITVNAVSPGMIETDLTAGLAPARREAMLARIPLGRFGSAAEVARAVAFLAGEEAGYIMGQVIRVDGGLRT